MHADGFTQVWNTDLSEVVVKQQQEKFPHMRWDVMDAMDTGLPNESLEAVIDKSLIDTLMCCQNSFKMLRCFMTEMYRIMQPRSFFMTFSLHTIDEVRKIFEQPYLHWKVDYFRLRCSRWNETDQRRTSVAHTMIVCEKIPASEPIPIDIPLSLSGTLTPEMEARLEKHAAATVERVAFDCASKGDLVIALDKALVSLEREWDEATRLARLQELGLVDANGKVLGEHDDDSDGGDTDDNDDDDDDDDDDDGDVYNSDESENGGVSGDKGGSGNDDTEVTKAGAASGTVSAPRAAVPNSKNE